MISNAYILNTNHLKSGIFTEAVQAKCPAHGYKTMNHLEFVPAKSQLAAPYTNDYDTLLPFTFGIPHSYGCIFTEAILAQVPRLKHWVELQAPGSLPRKPMQRI